MSKLLILFIFILSFSFTFGQDENKLETAHYRNTTIRILDDLEPLTKYIIEHSGLDPKH